MADKIKLNKIYKKDFKTVFDTIKKVVESNYNVIDINEDLGIIEARGDLLAIPNLMAYLITVRKINEDFTEVLIEGKSRKKIAVDTLKARENNVDRLFRKIDKELS